MPQTNQNPLVNFDFDALNDPEFLEDSVREEIITPILRSLGYAPTGDHRIVRSRRLAHPYVSIGSKSRSVTLVPDYLLLVDDKPSWILDAKKPTESVFDKGHNEQAYGYSIHHEVRASYFALCNGRELAVYSTSGPATSPHFKAELRAMTDECWNSMFHTLSPMFMRDVGKPFHKDFGVHLTRLGVPKTTQITLLDVPISTISLLDNGNMMVTAALDLDGSTYAVAFDFDIRLSLPQLKAQLSPEVGEFLETVIARGEPAMVRVEGSSPTASITCHLADKMEENDDEIYLPLWVDTFF